MMGVRGILSAASLLPVLFTLLCLSFLSVEAARSRESQSGRFNSSNNNDSTLSVEESLFQKFIQRFNKTYAVSSQEYFKRFKIFKESLLKHDLLNAIGIATHRDHATYGITKFSDLTTDEFRSRFLGSVRTPEQRSQNSWVSGLLGRLVRSVPSAFDLRNIKPPVVSPVKNQKSCGACWAFSVIECMETQIALKTKRLTQLSPQELVDCGTAAGDGGCRGGIPCKTLDWLNRTKTSLVPESTYPYTAKKGNCRIIQNSTLNAVVTDYSCGNYIANEEQVMPSMLYNHGPLSISVDAESWQYYLGGIIQYHCTPTFLNHAVQIVGYDMSGDIPYYIVRNSWGADWGINGYLRIKIGNNVCGVASAVQTVSV